MTDKLPPNLLALFAPRPPLRWVPPCDNPPEKRHTANIQGLASFLPALAEYEREYEYNATESWLEARDRKKREKEEAMEKIKADLPKYYNPAEDPNVRGDAFKTLIVARLDYKADEHDLEREFSRFGPIERIRIIRDTHADEKGNKKRKPHRGYAFVVFDREKDMRAALESCDGMRIKDRRIKVDVERGRTVKGWRPARLGGGLGGRNYTKALPARPTGPGGFGGPGGYRGGFGGGFRGRDRGFRGGPGGFGDRGGGGFRGGNFGDRGGGFGGDRGGGRNFSAPNGFAPSGAPSGPGGGRDGGFGGRDDRRGGSGAGGGYGGRDGGRSYDDRSGGGYRDRNVRQSGSNMEPIRPRGENGGYHGDSGSRDGGRDGSRDGGSSRRDYDRPRDHDDSRKRGYEGGYEDPRKIRRY